MIKGISFDEINGSGWMDIDDIGDSVQFDYVQGDGYGYSFSLPKDNLDELIEFLQSCKHTSK